MFVRRLNELRVIVRLAPAAPLLIKEGRHHEHGDRARLSFNRAVPRDPRRPRRRDGRGYGDWSDSDDSFDMAFVWTATVDGPRFYLPGSSLRGALRSSAERLIGRWRPELVVPSAPFADENLAQRWVLRERAQENQPVSAHIYRMAGPIERCFGHTALRGRWRIDDAFMPEERPPHTIVRDGVGIDRRTGAARENIKFQFEAIAGGEFETTFTIVNYELWQLGLLSYLLADLDGGAIRLGYGARRGLGRVRVAATELRFRWYGAPPESADGGQRLPALAELARRANIPDCADYDFRDADIALVLPLEADLASDLGSNRRVVPPRRPAADGFAPTDWRAAPWPALADTLPEILAAWEVPAALRAAGGTS